MSDLPISLDGQLYQLKPGQNLLDGLQQAGADIPSSCRSGVCGSCLVRAEADTVVPAEAQKNLREEKKRQGYFLACRCWPTAPMSLQVAETSRPKFVARVLDKKLLAPDVACVRLERPAGFDFLAGQYAHFHFADGAVRSYSLASLPDEETLDIHVRRVPGGRASEWFFGDCAAGDALRLASAQGDCCYLPGADETPLLLVGFGTGVAPLQAIARAALRESATRPVFFYQAGLHVGRLYFREELRILSAGHENFRYQEVVLKAEGESKMRAGQMADVLRADRTLWAGCRAFLCGDGESVLKLRKTLFLAGVPMRQIRADAFVESRASAAATPPAAI